VHERRNILVPFEGDAVAISALRSATVHGARSLAVPAGEIAKGRWADLIAVDLDDPHLAGCDDGSLLAGIIFSADSRAISDVFVGGEQVVRDGRHPLAAESGRELSRTAARIFA
jgi:formimidoylglutamate deiminase